MIEYLTLIGSITGLLTGAFVLYDRYAKGRPIASLAFDRKETRTDVSLRISNIGLYDIAILNVICSPDIYRLAESAEIKSVIRAAIGYDVYFSIAPSQSRELRLVARVVDGMALEMKPQRVTFRISWRRCSSTWLPQVPIFIFADTRTIRKFGVELNSQ